MDTDDFRLKRFDMHVHTTASDGVFTPAEIVRQAAEAGLGGLAITDHDTYDGLMAAAGAVRQTGLTLIFGVELSCELAPAPGEAVREVHMLGYFYDPAKRELGNMLRCLQQQRRLRAVRILQALADAGMPLDQAFLLDYADAGAPGRGLIARKLVEAGYVRDTEEAFTKWLGRGCPAYVPRWRLNAGEAVRLLHRSGGVAVMAHPIQAGDDRLVGLLAAAGLDGLECCHPDHDAALRQHYLGMAQDLGLAVTGGSDCHDGRLGSHTADGAEVLELLRRRQAGQRANCRI